MTKGMKWYRIEWQSSKDGIEKLRKRHERECPNDKFRVARVKGQSGRMGWGLYVYNAPTIKIGAANTVQAFQRKFGGKEYMIHKSDLTKGQANKLAAELRKKRIGDYRTLVRISPMTGIFRGGNRYNVYTAFTSR